MFSVSQWSNAQTLDPSSELDAAREAIQSGDYDGALRHTVPVLAAAVAELQAHRSTVEIVTAPKYIVGTAPRGLLVILDQTKQALAGRDMLRVREFTVTLGTALSREIEAHKPSNTDILTGLQQSAVGASAFHRYLLLPGLSKASYAAGEVTEAFSYANELLAAASMHPEWAQGDAIHQGNIVLGRVALARGDITSARVHLLAAGRTPGSPVQKSFGPSMALAKELLDKNEREVVVQYLSECSQFWAMDRGRLSEWTALINQGKIPDFGSNLLY
jgi:hypothetical protein